MKPPAVFGAHHAPGSWPFRIAVRAGASLRVDACDAWRMDRPHEEQRSRSEGPSPTDVDDDPGEALEDYISELDGPLGVDDAVTPEEQLDGDTIDRYNRREDRDRHRPDTSVDLTDGDEDDGVDDEPELVAEAGPPGEGPEAPEQAAVHIRDDAPGVVDHPDDYTEW